MPRATRKGLPLVPPAPLAFFPSSDELRRALLEWARSDGVAWVFVFKALLTASLALWLAYRLELPQPSTVLVTVFIVMQTQSGQVLAKSFYRIVGTLIGLSVMVTLIALFAQERVLFLACLALWVGLCTAGAARYRDFRGYACVLAGYTATMIGIPATAHPEGAFMAALWRVLEISLGILCTGTVSAIFLPQTSGAALRNTLYGRFRDFAGFAAEGLQGSLDGERFGELSARFVAQSVGLENLRSATTFEDPHMRLRSGRLIRLNNEFMVMTSRFHGLHRLLERLRGRGAQNVLEVLAPCLAELAGLLAPIRERTPTDADAARLAERIEAYKPELMQNIRQARQRLVEQRPGENDLLDFNTAAELAFRFTDDLHNYALTHASLAEHHHAREQWKESFVARANPVAALVAGARSALMIGLLGTFWIQTSWPHGGTFALTAVLISALSSTSPNPGRLSLQLTLGTLAGACTGLFVLLYLLPHVDGFPMLLCCLLPVFAVGALLLWRPQWNGYGVGLLVWFCFASLPANMARYDALAFFNEYLALLLSMVLATVAARVILPPNRPWMWKRLEHDLRERVVFAISGKSKGLVSGFESGTRDLLNQAYTFSAGRPDVQRRLLGWMFLVLEVGQAIIELRLEQQRLPQEPCYAERTAWRRAIRLMGRALIRLFLQPGPSNRQRALHAVNQAIMAVRAAPEPRAPQFDTSPLRRVLSYLHFIRSALLDPQSPLGQERNP
ncbi:FUSC family protein [Pseudomonas aeruginosa]|uniref:FUSC family protein n=2 Tax=Pseudomonas aeruginosa TaxID=287 RepID=UPI0007A81580|nr:FUSC family protein [Pseudomonas aeruginosa]AYK24868.1 FUSC family protein [Pseudomonas aeruginosa]EIU2893367.1 FUSC family protein [Pseudomonas aeruginosa]EIU2919957.1 FUSC family protein [Pseudomonas aeruginosa]EJN6721399.1 FUSC family protein [Pseudomonas aeruginosa]EKU2415001.1 FUSC family protein [Pseudomonas aeruginosa]